MPLYLHPALSSVAHAGLPGSEILPRSPGPIDFAQRGSMLVVAAGWLVLSASLLGRRDDAFPAIRKGAGLWLGCTSYRAVITCAVSRSRSASSGHPFLELRREPASLAAMPSALLLAWSTPSRAVQRSGTTSRWLESGYWKVAETSLAMAAIVVHYGSLSLHKPLIPLACAPEAVAVACLLLFVGWITEVQWVPSWQLAACVFAVRHCQVGEHDVNLLAHHNFRGGAQSQI